jgi:hypothetical protein
MWRGGGPAYDTDAGRTAYAAPSAPGLSSQDASHEMEHFCVPRHGSGKRVQAVYFDGSATAIKARELWSLKWHRQWDQAWQGQNYSLPGWLKAE